MKAVVAAFNQEKALVGAFSVITNLRMELFQALVSGVSLGAATAVCRVRQSRMRYAVSAISIWPGAHSRCTRLPT